MDALEFGLYLRSLRKAKKMTIRQLELYSGVSNAYLSHIENGKRGIPNPDILKKLSPHLGVGYKELMEIAGYLDVDDNDSSININDVIYEKINRNLLSTVREVENVANKYDASTSDPEFKEILLKALDLALAARRKNDQ
jgi:Predicted transcriptional regulators